MDIFFSITGAAVIAIFLQNSIFERALGSNILLYAARNRNNVVGFSVVIVYVSTLSSAAVWLLDSNLSGFDYYSILMPFLYILIVSVIYIFNLVLIWRFLPKLFIKIKTYVHISVFNCSVLGALFLNSQLGSDIWHYLGFGFGTGIGFFLAGYLLYIVHARLNSELVPSAFRGIPIMLVYVGILSLAFYAFVGYSTVINV